MKCYLDEIGLLREIRELGYGDYYELCVGSSGEQEDVSLQPAEVKLVRAIREGLDIEHLNIRDGLPNFIRVTTESEFADRASITRKLS